MPFDYHVLNLTHTLVLTAVSLFIHVTTNYTYTHSLPDRHRLQSAADPLLSPAEAHVLPDMRLCDRHLQLR